MIKSSIFAAIIACLACLSVVSTQSTTAPPAVVVGPTAPANGIVCTQQNVFRLCIRNWVAGGGPAICEIDRNDEAKYYRCLCQQYSNHAYCFQAFCPSDPTLINLREDANSACVRARVTLTAQTETLLATDPVTRAATTATTAANGITSAPVASTATIVTPSSTPLSFPSPANAIVPSGVATVFAVIAVIAVVLAARRF
ncbi:hypothetical protein BC829DRAFT_422181 [Chytridium lagenaria]|nr:hypothetical protein BC829DRAFT_422181 [Chytridium lagenaria]